MDPQMYKAASNGESSFFDSLTASDSTLLQFTTEKNTVLHIAVQFKQYEVAKKIVSLRGCLAMQTNSKGNTPLHVAAKLGNHEMVRFLIDHAEDRDVETGARQLLSMVNLGGDTVLHIAVQHGNFEVVNELIEEDSKLAMCVNKAGESALFLAVDRQHYEIASHILRATPECSCAGRHGMNVLHALVIQTSNYINQRTSEMSLVDQIIQNDQTQSLSERFEINREQPPRRSFGTIQEDFVREVMEKYPFTIKQGDDSGWTPLHIATQMGNEKYVKLLLKNGNSPAYVKNNEGLSTFHIATKEGNVNVMKELITTSPDIYELLDNRGQTALHAVAESGKEKAVSFFLNKPEFEGLINEQDKEGNTPMHLAAIKGHDKVVHLLENGKGLDLNAKNKEGFTTLDYILLRKELDVFEKIRNYMIKRRMRMKGAQPSLMGVLLKLGIREAGDGKGMARSDSVKEENQNNLLVDDKGTAGLDYVKEGSQTNLLIATLIATVTFTAAFTVPGGYHQSKDEGLAVFGKRASFRAFLIANTLAFGLSISSILIHIYASIGWGGFAFRKSVPRRSSDCIFYAIIALLVAFISGTYTVVPHYLGITAAVILSLLFYITLWGIRSYGRAGKANSLGISAAFILPLLLSITLLGLILFTRTGITAAFNLPLLLIIPLLGLILFRIAAKVKSG